MVCFCECVYRLIVFLVTRVPPQNQWPGWLLAQFSSTQQVNELPGLPSNINPLHGYVGLISLLCIQVSNFFFVKKNGGTKVVLILGIFHEIDISDPPSMDKWLTGTPSKAGSCVSPSWQLSRTFGWRESQTRIQTVRCGKNPPMVADVMGFLRYIQVIETC